MQAPRAASFRALLSDGWPFRHGGQSDLARPTAFSAGGGRATFEDEALVRLRAVVSRALLVAATVLTVAAVDAEAYVPYACRIDANGDPSYQQRLGPLIPPADAAAREATGAQYASLWVLNRDQGWHIGLAPGTLSTTQAREAIMNGVRSRVSADDAVYLADHLRVDEQPYSEADLRAVQAQIGVQMPTGFGWTVGVGCQNSDARRVEVALFNDSTTEQRAQVHRVVDPYGDRGFVYVSAFGPPVADVLSLPSAPVAVPRDAVRLRNYVSVRVTRTAIVVRINARRRPQVASVRAAGRVLSGARLARTLRLTRRSVTVTLRLRDGRSTRRTFVRPKHLANAAIASAAATSSGDDALGARS